LRRDLLANQSAPDILEQIDELGPHGIRIHAQIVLMPGRNDGRALERTIADLAARYPWVESAAVVPVGLTRHSRTSIRPLEKADAEAAIRTVLATQRRFRREHGVGFVYASDELYLLAGRPLPSPASYDDYPQFQNGVGLVQLFRAEWKRAARRLPTAVDPPRRVCWATGSLLAPILREMADGLRVEGLSVHVIPVESSLFGGAVTIAGLMSGEDIATAMSDEPCDRLTLPRSMFDTAAGLRTIDGWTVGDIAERLGVDVVIGESPRDLLMKTLEEPARPERTLGAVAG
jgi:putative radical SAM enzyme (TIGR03279 family)